MLVTFAESLFLKVRLVGIPPRVVIGFEWFGCQNQSLK